MSGRSRGACGKNKRWPFLPHVSRHACFYESSSSSVAIPRNLTPNLKQRIFLLTCTEGTKTDRASKVLNAETPARPGCFILFCFTGTYPRPSLWPSACSLATGGWWWWCARQHLSCILGRIYHIFFAPRKACRGERRRAPLFVLNLSTYHLLSLL